MVVVQAARHVDLYISGHVSGSFWIDLRGGDDDLCINQVLVERGVFTLFIGCGNQLVTLVFNPFPDSEFVFGCPK